jgi:ketosteroid isomerase-like protein
VLAPPGEASVTGIREIQSRYESLFANWQPDIEGRLDSLIVDGSTATVHGHNGGWLRTLAAGGTDRRLDDTYTMTLERRAGTWQIHRLQWTRNQP